MLPTGVPHVLAEPEVELATAEWVDWWNHRRLHGAIDDMPPAEFEALYHHQRVAADAA